MNIDYIIDNVTEKGYRIKKTTVLKNGRTKECFAVGASEEQLERVFYFDQLENLSDNNIIEHIMDRMAESVVPECNTEILNSYEAAKSHIIPCLSYYALPDGIISTMEHDFFMYFRVIYDSLTDDLMSSVVTKAMFDSWNVNLDTFVENALDNLKSTIEIKSLDEVVGAPDGTTGMYILTNNTKIYGASAMLDNSTLDKVRELYNGKNYWILPSSIHEVLTVCDNGQTPEELQILVADVNHNEVREDEWLSFSVYYYDGERVKMFLPED